MACIAGVGFCSDSSSLADLGRSFFSVELFFLATAVVLLWLLVSLLQSGDKLVRLVLLYTRNVLWDLSDTKLKIDFLLT